LYKTKRILVAPLDWGLGHASRCIPIIKYLLLKKIEVIIASSGEALTLLKIEFPSLEFIELPSNDIYYSSSNSQATAIGLQLIKLNRNIKRENNLIQKIIREKKIDAIISDNRYGIYSGKIPSIIITHQLNILMPKGYTIFSILINRTIKRLINKFDECWIPDNDSETDNLSGKLSHARLDINKKFIGVLTRMNYSENYVCTNDILVILSGPEPQRSLLEKKLIFQLEKYLDKTIVIVRGTEKYNPIIHPHIQFYNLIKSTELNKLIEASEIIISRSGYSSVMDLSQSRKKLILIPTPGQTEQEYLAKYLVEKKYCISELQFELNLDRALYNLNSRLAFPTINTTTFITSIDNLLDQLK
jgi:uncharacterized protein (TIGR00661 family)